MDVMLWLTIPRDWINTFCPTSSSLALPLTVEANGNKIMYLTHV